MRNPKTFEEGMQRLDETLAKLNDPEMLLHCLPGATKSWRRPSFRWKKLMPVCRIRFRQARMKNELRTRI